MHLLNGLFGTHQVSSSTSFAHYFYMELNQPLSDASVANVNDNMQVMAQIVPVLRFYCKACMLNLNEVC